MLDWNEVQIAYQIGKQYFTIQTAEDGYDYTFYNEDYQEDDGGIYDNPTIYVDEAASDILEDKGYSLEDAKVVDYEELMADVEEVQEKEGDEGCHPGSAAGCPVTGGMGGGGSGSRRNPGNRYAERGPCPCHEEPSPFEDGLGGDRPLAGCKGRGLGPGSDFLFLFLGANQWRDTQ